MSQRCLRIHRKEGCSGWEERKASCACVPVHAYTRACVGKKNEAMRAGATDYLVKPVSPDRLMQALRSVLVAQLPLSFSEAAQD